MPAQDDETIVKYLSIFEDHLASLYPADERNLGSTFLPSTNCCWTPEEKNIFFHALSIHSRLRPDLIAEELPTKSVVDICMFIDLFEENLGNHPPFSVRQELPIAYDASEEWIEEENRLAERLIEAEVRWEEERLRRLRKSRTDTAMRVVKANAGEVNADRETTRRAQKQARTEIKRGYAVEDVMRSLDASHLKVLDIMLKEGDEAVMLAATREDFDEKDMHAQPAAASSQFGSNDRAPAMDMDSTTDETVIDPVLLEMSAQETAATVGSSTPSSTGLYSSIPLQSSFDPPPEPTYDPYSEGYQALSSPVALTPAATPDHSNDGDDAKQAALREQLKYAQTLSPKSRKLYEKRVRMRFKRAELSGGVVSLDMHVKRGRKPKHGKPPRMGVKRKRSSEDEERPGDGNRDKDSSDQHHPEDLEGDESDKEKTSDRKSRTRTSVQAKIQKMLQEGHVDYAMLQRENLDLFHLENLERLMRLNNTLHNAPADVNTRISEETLKFLHALVSIFVTDLVRKAVVCRELEGKMKQRTKVWRFKEGEITDSAVHHAAEMLGIRSLTKKEHFTATLAVLGYQGGDDKEEEEEGDLSGSGSESDRNRDGSDDDDDSDDNGQDILSAPSLAQQATSSLYREIQSPMFWLPRIYRHTMSSSLFPNTKNHGDESDVLWDFNNDDDKDEDEDEEDGGVMSTLAVELEEDYQLDATDMAASEAYDRDLRHVLAGTMSAQQAREKHEKPPSTKRRRKSDERPSSSIKGKGKVVSEPFVYDEDDDNGVDDDDYVP